MLAALYTMQGMNVGLAFDAYPVLLRHAGVSLETLSLLPLASLPWIVKFLWAPLLDNYWSPRFGRRKSWIIPAQCLQGCLLVVIALLPFNTATTSILMVVIFVSCMVGSTQDIATDGLAADLSHGKTLVNANAVQVGGLAGGMLLGGPGVLMCSEVLDKTQAILLMAGLVWATVGWLLLWSEPAGPRISRSPARLRKTWERKGFMPLFALALFAPLAGSILYNLVRMILLDGGLSISEVGVLTGIEGYGSVLMGSVLASWLLLHGRLFWMFLVASVLVLLASLGWLLLLQLPGALHSWLPVGLIATTGLGLGIINVSTFKLLMDYVQRGDQAATDYAVFQSTGLGSDIMASMLSTAVSAWLGYTAGVALSTLAAIWLIVGWWLIGRAWSMPTPPEAVH
ncbi:hypothetical protein BXU06_11790 [Aquaspirillum sp. LM1]|nr:hypothetical protein BXU06_11790 [Aquaspirillum sp. LM1]